MHYDGLRGCCTGGGCRCAFVCTVCTAITLTVASACSLVVAAYACSVSFWKRMRDGGRTLVASCDCATTALTAPLQVLSQVPHELKSMDPETCSSQPSLPQRCFRTIVHEEHGGCWALCRRMGPFAVRIPVDHQLERLQSAPSRLKKITVREVQRSHATKARRVEGRSMIDSQCGSGLSIFLRNRPEYPSRLLEVGQQWAHQR